LIFLLKNYKFFLHLCEKPTQDKIKHNTNDRKRIIKIVFETGLKIHKKLGAGLFEHVYEECLFYELKKPDFS
jgi:hypothetical protein